MTYELFKMGSLYLGGVAQHVAQTPTKDCDIPKYDGKSFVAIGDTAQDKAITWVKPKGMDLLVADRALLTDISLAQVNAAGFLRGQLITIDGTKYTCRLLNVGKDAEDAHNEWDRCLDIVGEGNDIWHYLSVCFWGREPVTTSSRISYACRGGYSARYWGSSDIWYGSAGHGFRPALEPWEKGSLY